MTGVGTPDTWRQLLPNTRAGSDGRQSTTKRHHNVNMNVSYMNYKIFMSYCLFCLYQCIYLIYRVLLYFYVNVQSDHE